MQANDQSCNPFLRSILTHRRTPSLRENPSTIHESEQSKRVEMYESLPLKGIILLKEDETRPIGTKKSK